MRILYVAAGTPVPGTHGGSVHALELCRALSRRGHRVHVAALPGEVDAVSSTDVSPAHGPSAADEGDGDPGRRRGSGDGELHLHPLRRGLPVPQLEWTRAGQVLRLARRLRPDVVVERFYTFGGTGLLAARRLGLPAVLEVNSPARPYPGSLRDALDRLTLVRPVDRWRRRQLGMADAYYATSELLLPEELQDRVTVVVNGVDPDRIRPGEPAADTGPLRCVYVSSFRPWHGVEDLVEAARECRDREVPLRIVCLGSGPGWDEARRAVEAAELGEIVRLRGRVPHADVPGHLAAADVGLAPFDPARHSALELGWFWSPIKIFEYLAAGLAVVTAEIPELRRLLSAEVAVFYPPGSPAALADRLAWLAGHRQRLREMGRAARTLATERYTWERQASRVESVLERVVEP